MNTPVDILLVDDEPRNLDVLESILNAPDYRLVRAQTGEAALLALVQSDFACIVLDIQMPGMSGFEIARLIKTRKRSQHIPIIFLTAFFHEEKDILQGYGTGAVDYLTKPLNPQILRSKVGVFAELFRTARALSATNAALEQQVVQRQQAEAALQQANTALEGRVKERTAALSQTNRELRESEERLQLALKSGTMGAWEWNISTGQVRWSPSLEEIHGLPSGTFGGRFDDFKRDVHPDDLESVLAKIQTTLETGSEYNVAYRMKRSDGAVRWLEAFGKPISGPNGQPQRLAGICMDVTERKLAERRLACNLAVARILAESPALSDATPRILQTIAETLGWAVGAAWLPDVRDNVLRCLKVWHDPVVKCDKFEADSYARTFAPGIGLPGRIWTSLKPSWIPDVSRDNNFPRAATASADKLHSAFAFPILSGTEFQAVMEFFSHEIREPDDAQLAMFTGIGNQVGQFMERQRAAEALQQSEQRLRLALAGGKMGTFEVDLASGRTYISTAEGQSDGLESGPTEVDKDHLLQRINAEDRQALVAKIQNVARVGGDFQVEFRMDGTRNGDARWIASTGTIVRDPTGQAARLIGVHFDITPRKQAEAELLMAHEQLEQRVRERTAELSQANASLHDEVLAHKRVEAARARLAAIVESSSDAIISATLDETIISWNRGAERIYGYSAEEMLGRSLTVIDPPDRCDEFLQAVERIQRSEVVEPFETLRVRKDGSRIDVFLTLSPIKDDTGCVIGISQVARDITDRKQAEKALQESEARLQAIMDNSPAMIFLKDLEGRYLHFNRPFSKAFRLQLESAIGKTDHEIFPRKQAAAFRANDHKVIEVGHPVTFDEVAVHDDGPHFSIVTKFPLHDADGKIYAVGGIVTDVTERRRLETEVLQISEREQRRIAQDLHDGLGQQLAGISCLSDVLKKNLQEQASLEAPAAARISKLLDGTVAQTRLLSRGLYPVAAEPTGLMDAFVELAASVTELFSVECRFQPQHPVLVEDNTIANHLYRIGQEAVTNALKHGKAHQVDIKLSSTAEQIILAVLDNGRGLKKAARNGNGLGLRIMNYRADIMGGSLAVQKGARGGTEVVCTVPRTRGEALRAGVAEKG